MYCGDEVGALVTDIGTYSTRFGSSGCDSPKTIFTTSIGTNLNSKNSYIVDGSKLRYVSENIEINNPITNEDLNWDSVETILNYGIENILFGSNSITEIPLLLAENYFNTPERKEKLLEILFESINVPATFTCNNSTLGSFCFGRPTSLIIDFGASQTRITPVVDGFSLNKSIITTNRGGNYIDKLILQSLTSNIPSLSLSTTTSTSTSTNSNSTNSKKRGYNEISEQSPILNDINNLNGVKIKPWFLVSPQTSNFEYKQSFLDYHISHIIRDIKHWMSLVSNSTNQNNIDNNESGISTIQSIVSSIPSYELPDGTIVSSSLDLCLCAEKAFFQSSNSNNNSNNNEERKTSIDDEKRNNRRISNKSIKIESNNSNSNNNNNNSNSRTMNLNISNYDETQSISLPNMIWNTILKCDVDIRRELLNNMLFIGGGSLIDGLIPRIISELNSITPNSIKVKGVSNTINIEKHHAAWIGGSILSICGSFQQLWISKQEYNEYGPKIYLRKGQH